MKLLSIILTALAILGLEFLLHGCTNVRPILAEAPAYTQTLYHEGRVIESVIDIRDSRHPEHEAWVAAWVQANCVK